MNTIDTLEFRALMTKHGDTVNGLAKVLGIHPKTLYYKYSGCDNRANFTLNEVQIIMNRYNLNPDEVVSIFLSTHCEQTQ